MNRLSKGFSACVAVMTLMLLSILLFIADQKSVRGLHDGDYSGVYYREDGSRLSSLFEPETGSRLPFQVASSARTGTNCSDRQEVKDNVLASIFGRLLALIGPTDVHAMQYGCDPDPCRGSYYTYEWRECPPACFGWFKWHYSDPQKAQPNDGYQYTGQEGCIWCGGCKEESCVS